MALIVVLIVALVVVQTWFDWRDARRQIALAEWASGVALAGVAAVLLTAATSLGSILYQGAAGRLADGFDSAYFWPELGFLLCALGIIVAAVRKKSVRTLLLFTGILTFALWLGLAFAT